VPRVRPLSNIASCDCPAVFLRTTFNPLTDDPGTIGINFYWRPRSKSQPARTGGRGRIRTSVARKERQIYSLLVLATHPPVLENSFKRLTACPENSCQQTQRAASENTKRTRVKRHQPVDLGTEDSLRLIPPQNFWWSWRRELNPRPSDYKSDALPAELRQRSQTEQG
jgi:hypothetical protein